MPYELDITIDGTGITDNAAKIIALLIMGLGYEDISSVLWLKKGIIRNEVCDTYGRMRIPSDHGALILAAELNGYDHYCHVNGKDILDKDERNRLIALNPRILRESKKLVLILE